MNPASRPPQHEAPADREATRAVLIERIEAAFANVALGGGRSMHQADAVDDYEPEDVVAKARALDTEERWQDIADEKVARFPSVLPFFDPEGFRFHYPRFMIFALRNEDSESASPDTAIFSSDIEGWPDRFSLFNEEQKEVVRAFRAFYADRLK